MFNLHVPEVSVREVSHARNHHGRERQSITDAEVANHEVAPLVRDRAGCPFRSGKVESCGSLKAAAEKLGMSYRGAWGKIKITEELIGRKLIERAGCRRAGYHLTPFGSVVANSFDAWFREVEAFALVKSKELLPFSLSKYE